MIKIIIINNTSYNLRKNRYNRTSLDPLPSWDLGWVHLFITKYKLNWFFIIKNSPTLEIE